MTNPNRAKKILADHFAGVSGSEFSGNLARYSAAPAHQDSLDLAATAPAEASLAVPQQLPFAPELTARAYWATALTGLGEDERENVDALGSLTQEVLAEHGISLYQPGQHSDPIHNADIADHDVVNMDREAVKGADLLVHLADYPSTGAGEELAWAQEALVPIIVVRRAGTRVSRMITGLPALMVHIEYDRADSTLGALRESLSSAVTQLRPALEARKLAFSHYDSNMVGNRIRVLRESMGLTRADIEDCAPHLRQVSLKFIEENTDRTSNPTLAQLREIAALLKTTVADLVEPDLDERLLWQLQRWAQQGTREALVARAANSGITEPDFRKALSRYLGEIIRRVNSEE